MKAIPSISGRKYGYFRSKHVNPFRRRYALRMGAAAPLPPSVDLSPQCPPVYDQLTLGSCTANAIAAALQFEQMQRTGPTLNPPSRLFIYWNERSMEGTTNQDAGAFGGDGITSLETLGVPDETLWPYDVTQFAVQPDTQAFVAAPAYKVLQREVIATLQEIKQALNDKHLVIFGISLYESFESLAVAQTGIVPDPQPSEGFLGGHEMTIVGYDDSTGRFKVRNSWSAAWGKSGYCWISFNYMVSAGSDFEVITQIA